MKRTLALSLLALASAAPALAQQGVPAPPDCTGVSPPPPPNTGGGGARPGEGDAVFPGSGQIFVTSPPSGVLAPLNVEIRLGGSVGELDFDPPTFAIELVGDDGGRLPFTRAGAVLHPDQLEAGQTYTVRVSATEANPCQGCFFPSEATFTTTDVIDTEAPSIDDVPFVNAFVFPPPELLQQCGIFSQDTHQIAIAAAGLPRDAWLTVAARTPATDPRALFETYLATTTVGTFTTNLGQIPVVLGDEFLVALSLRDLAGNVGPARVVRTHARSFTEAQTPPDQLEPLTCNMPERPEVIGRATVPSNGEVHVRFPFEEHPLGLRVDADTVFALAPAADSYLGHIYETGDTLPEGATLEVVSLPCPRCVCPGCAGLAEGTTVTVGAADTTPPEQIAEATFDEENDVTPSTDVCAPDRPALIVRFRQQDRGTAPVDLRYDAALQLDGGVFYDVGRGLVPTEDADGLALRIETGLGRVLGDAFTLQLTARDAGGNVTTSTLTHERELDAAGGCGCAGSRTPGSGGTRGDVVAAVLFAVALRLRRRAHR